MIHDETLIHKLLKQHLIIIPNEIMACSIKLYDFINFIFSTDN